jgi:hypothetical protein
MQEYLDFIVDYFWKEIKHGYMILGLCTNFFFFFFFLKTNFLFRSDSNLLQIKKEIKFKILIYSGNEKLMEKHRKKKFALGIFWFRIFFEFISLINVNYCFIYLIVCCFIVFLFSKIITQYKWNLCK